MKFLHKTQKRLGGKLSCNWLIMLVTMATPISSHVKNKDSIFNARDEDMIFLVKGKILVFYQYLYNKVFLSLSFKFYPISFIV